MRGHSDQDTELTQETEGETFNTEQVDSEETSEEQDRNEDEKKKNIFNVCLINGRLIF